MPSLLALAICVAFIAYLLIIERYNNSSPSSATWIPTLWLLLSASRPISLWLGLESTATEEGTPIDRYFLVMLLSIALLILRHRRFHSSLVIRQYPWLIALILFMLASLAWAELPFVSFKRWSRGLIVVVMALIVASERDPGRALESVFRRTVYILIPLSYLLVNYYGDYGRIFLHTEGLMMWIGASTHKNSLAQLCLLCILFFLWSFLRTRRTHSHVASPAQRRFDFLLVATSLYLMCGPEHVPTYCAASMAALILGVSALCGIYFCRTSNAFRPLTLGVIILATVAFGLATPLLGKLPFLDLSSSLGRDSTLTGRTEIWSRLLPFVKQRPFLGFGFGGFWNNQRTDVMSVTQGHNGYLDVLLELGVVGLFLIVGFLVSVIEKANRELRVHYDWAAFRIVWLLIVAVHNTAESSISSLARFLTAILIFQLIGLHSTIASSNAVLSAGIDDVHGLETVKSKIQCSSF